jgi:DNA-binding GntR family transcriptional regulator
MEDSHIDTDSFTPLYEQVRLKLMEQITSGLWDDGSPLPSELKLAENFGVSRITIRQAVSEIVRNGYLYRKQGKGTFIRNRDAYYLLGGVHNFLKNAQVMGKAARTDVIVDEWRAADEAVAGRLNLPVGDRFLFIKLLRYLDDEVVGWQTIHVSPEIGNLVDVDALTEKHALNPLLRIKGRRVAESQIVQGARLAGGDDIALLDCAPNSPILCSEYTEYGAEGKIYSFSEVAFRADRFKWVFKVVGP